MSDNNIKAKLSVGVAYSGDGSGLTAEQERQLNKIPMIEQSVEEITNDLNSKANTSDIPTKTSELYNDSGFLTSIPSEYVTEQEMNEAIANSSSGTGGTGLTAEQEEQLNKIPEIETSINDINESLNTKANTSDIPTNTSELYNDSGFLTSIPSEYVTEQEMNEAIANISSGGTVDLSGYATKDDLNTKANTSDIPTKTSELYNDSGFLTSIPSEYVTEQEMNEAIANAGTGESVDFSNYYTKSEIDTVLTLKEDKTSVSFADSSPTKTLTGRVDEKIIGQEYLGGYIEIQPDSWDGSNCDTDKISRLWGFPHSLLSAEQVRIKDDVLKGNGYGIMYIRFPLGFAYRGYRNIDETSGLAKNIGERYSQQNTALKLFFENIAKAGGGLAPEYWCPAPYWLTGGAYHSSSGNKLTAGGEYDRTITLASIKSSDPVQYNAQIEAFTDAIVDDLEYLHQNICPVRMFGLQNEPVYGSQPYGACQYDEQTYNDVLEVLYPKIQASTVLSTYNNELNEVKLLVASSDEGNPFSGIAATYIKNHSNNIWGYTHHMMRKISGEVAYEGANRGADYYKSNHYTNYVKMGHRNVFCNEYEYFGNNFDGDTNDFRCSNNMLHLINELVYGRAKVLHPVIHICKPIGQTASSTNTKGYCLYAANLKGEYGTDILATTNSNNLAKGTYYTNATMYNSWKMFNDNLPVNSYVVGDYINTVKNGGYVVLKHSGKLYIFMANNGSEDILITLTFDKNKHLNGKYYDAKCIGKPIESVNGNTINFVVPAYSGQCWIEDYMMPVSCIGISLSPSELNFTNHESQVLTATLIPSNTTDDLSYSVSPTGIVRISDNIVTPISNGTATITATCGSQTATCSITVALPLPDSISAVYTQGNTVVYSNTPLDNLKNNLTVTVSYSDGTSVITTDYTLSGTLSVGTSTVTVTYADKTTTFDVIVSEGDDITLTSEGLNVYIQAQDGCIGTTSDSVYILNLADDSKIYNNNYDNILSTNMYDSENKSLNFTSANKLTIKDNKYLVSPGGSYTLETMIKTSTLVKSSVKFIVANFDSKSNYGGSAFLCREKNIIEASYRPLQGTTVPIKTTLDINNTWTHLTAVVNSTDDTFSFYVNGILVNSTNITKYASIVRPVTMNTYSNPSFSDAYDINMIRQYTRALTASEVMSNYNYQLTLV